MHTPRFSVSRSLVAIAIVGSVAIGLPVHAQERLTGKPTKEQILQALTPQTSGPGVRTRGLSLGSGDAAKDAPDAPAHQSAGTGSGAPAARARAGPRSLDLEIPFEFGSDRLTTDGKEVLDQLGEALKSDQLSGAAAIVLEGHTDSRGSAAYNQVLSLRRAQSVKTFLAIKHSIPSFKLKAVGKGSTEPANPRNPEDAVNRRVRIIVEG